MWAHAVARESYRVGGFWLALAIAGVGCSGEPPIEREWTAADHGQPPEADPARVPQEPEDAPAETPEERRARAAGALWNVTCASCHGREGRGDGAGRPPGAQLPDFTDAAWQASRTDEQLADVITNGRNLMPGFAKQINPEGVQVLVEHVRTLRVGEP
jgi:mono/diheme cytochrome c family protein